MIIGIGVDLVDIPRFQRSVSRTPRLVERLFSPAERVLPPHSLAARFAAKEALIKALGGSDGLHWTEIEIAPEPSGRPWFRLTGSTAEVVGGRGIETLHLSMSHDAGLAIAYVVAEGPGGPGASGAAPGVALSGAAPGAGATAAAAGATAAGATAAAAGPPAAGATAADAPAAGASAADAKTYVPAENTGFSRQQRVLSATTYVFDGGSGGARP